MLLKILSACPVSRVACISLRLYSTGGKTSVGKKRFRLPVEQEAEKLVNYLCGSNLYQEGEDIKLKDDSEYPEWIWKMKIHDFPKLEDYDPKSKAFWEFCEIRHLFRTFRLKTARPHVTMAVGERERDYQERILRSRDRAILPEAIDHGWDPKEILEEPVDPRVLLKPEKIPEEMAYDKLQLPPLFDNRSYYRKMTKVYCKDRVEIMTTRVRHRRPKYF